MSLFDSITVFQACPTCGKGQSLEAQTKNLSCGMYCYRPLPEDWETSELQKAFRIGLSVSPNFPLDKSVVVWKDQAEYTEAKATIPEEFAGMLNYVEVVADCIFCGAFFKGRIAIKDGKLRGSIYDIVQEVAEKKP